MLTTTQSKKHLLLLLFVSAITTASLAFLSAKPAYRSIITLTVVDSNTKAPIHQVQVKCLTCKPEKSFGFTDTLGTLRMKFSAPTGSLTFIKTGYLPRTVDIKEMWNRSLRVALLKEIDLEDALLIDKDSLGVVFEKDALGTDNSTKHISHIESKEMLPETRIAAKTVEYERVGEPTTTKVKAYKKELRKMSSYAEGKAYAPTFVAEDMSPASISNSIAGEATKAGQLTAGEVNDFAKWELWNDISAPTLESYQNSWKMQARKRYTVQVSNENRMPVVNAIVKLLDERDGVLWSAVTDNTGKAELWPDMFKEGNKAARIRVSYGNVSKEIKHPSTFQNGINFVKLTTGCNTPEAVDIAWVVDATGSMGDEITYLKTELNDVMDQAQKKFPKLKFSLGSIFYRDFGDAFLTQSCPFSTDISQMVGFINSQDAGGGGDFPEAVDTALGAALNKLQWNPQARARLLFLVLDAPPHQTAKEVANIERLTRQAAKMGIRIIPLAASGIDKSTEYLMRCLALATNGTYSFLTDDSGIGDSHIKPTTDEYKVEKANDLLVRLIGQLTQMAPCSRQMEAMKDSTLTDTMTVLNKFLPIETLDSIVKQDQTQQKDSTQDEQNQHNFNQWKYYPNPTQVTLFVEIEGKMGELYLTDIGGKILKRYTPGSEQRLTMDLSEYPSGIYYLRYYYEDKNLSGKVILVRE